MPRNAFEFMCQYIHFIDNANKKEKGHLQYNPQKIQYLVDKLMKGTRRAWTAGLQVTIDESMIKYCRHAIAFIQYMPAKPIKHGVKVFALCCAYSAILLGFEIFVGSNNTDTKPAPKDNNTNTAIGIV